MMEEYAYTAAERPFDDVQHVGIVITSLRQVPGQQHVGILHKDETTKEVRVLHLAWHYKLQNSQPKSSYAWVAPPILSRRARQVAARCRNIFRANKDGGIPYAFSQYMGCFDERTCKFLPGVDRRGLTCASFVLAVFDSTGLPLIKPDTWPASRAGDKEWQRHIIEQLKNDGASSDHLRDVESEVGSIRYRPEDVAGAGATEILPASFVTAQALVEKILKKLSANNLFT